MKAGREESHPTGGWDTREMSDTIGSLLDLRTGPMAAGGGCVARRDTGPVVFVRHALPGERVTARVTEVTRSFLRADAVEIHEASPFRVAPPCPAAGPGRCGGCDWQHVDLAEQRRLKARLIGEQLSHLAGLERRVQVEEVPGAPDGLGWRTRVRFAVDEDGYLGLRRHRSHELERLDACPIATASVEELGAERVQWEGAREVEVFAPVPHGVGDDQALVIVGGDRSLAARRLPRLDPGRVGMVVAGRTLRRPDRLEVRAAGRTYRVSAGSFWQVHRGAPDLLVEVVLRGLGPRPGERVADLYAGVGLYSVPLAEAVGPAGRVVAVERGRRPSKDAVHNTARLPWAEVRTAPVNPRVLAGLSPLDLVVLDPPREGAGTALMKALAGLDPAPRALAYVACDPASFARDLRVLLDAGWSVPTLRAFDLFPMTEHVELVAILRPPGSGASARTGR